MRPGGGKPKGNAYEREAGRLLSLWLTHGERPDIMSRNVLSGGSFTNAEKKGALSSRMPGDIMAAHPLAFRFLSRFSVECKHYQDINLMAYLLDPHERTFLGSVITLAKRQARHIGLTYMIIAKQDRREALVLVDGAVGHQILGALRQHGSRSPLPPMHHFLHGGNVYMMRFTDMLKTVNPDLLLEARK